MILGNTIIPMVGAKENLTKDVSGGWISSIINGLMMIPEVKIDYVFPHRAKKQILHGTVDNFSYFGFYQKSTDAAKYDNEIEVYFEKILREESPDIVHIMGTEFPHSLAMIRACEKIGIPNRAVISIQGLASICKMHYLAGLPYNIYNKFTLRDLLKTDNLKRQQAQYEKRGLFEIEAIKGVKHVIGRTDWDRICTSQINPEVKYHFCNETLREEFYKHQWDIENCERHSIFISQAHYPIKGLHFMLEAMPLILDRFPKSHLYVAGGNVTKGKSIKDKFRRSSYGQYIFELLSKKGLVSHVTFTGMLDEKEMCERFLKSHVFVSASTIENSSNSVGEAMLLGVPTVSSDVGGIKNLMSHKVDGFIYQHDAPYMLANYVCEIFDNDVLALRFSDNAKCHAKHIHDKIKNMRQLLNIYIEIDNATHEA